MLPDSSVFFNAYGCAFYQLSDALPPRSASRHGADTRHLRRRRRGPAARAVVRHPDTANAGCNRSGRLHSVAVLDVTNPSAPARVSRLRDARYLQSALAGARSTIESAGARRRTAVRKGSTCLDSTRRRATCPSIRRCQVKDWLEYLSLKNQQWPHGNSGVAWAHAALFLPR